MSPGFDSELIQGLTINVGEPGDEHFGAQMRWEFRHLDVETMHASDPTGVLYLAPGVGLQTNEHGNPFRIEADAARKLRDLLNIATARGYL